MEKIFKTKSVKERNSFIEKCYKENVKYSYSEKNNEGDYIVKYESENNKNETL